MAGKMPRGTRSPQTQFRRETNAPDAVVVWDLPIRLFHWLLAALVALAWISGEAELFTLHFTAGFAILGLILFRVSWGFAGSATARFAGFLRGPGAVFAHLRELASRTRTFHPTIGHNPAGGWMVVILLAATGLQAVFGLFTTDDIATDGPAVHRAADWLVSDLSTLHRLLGGALPALIGLHVAAILYYRLVRREDLLRPMLTGRLPPPPGVSTDLPPQPAQAPLTRALLLALVWTAAVATLAWIL
jgi:cytochrome b